MTVDTNIIALCSAVGGPLLWIGKSLARIVREVKNTSMIVRTCPGCAETVEKIDNANEHSL